MFGRTNDNYDTLIERYQNVLITLSEIQQNFNLLKIRVDGLELENSDLRDKVLRKIQKPKQHEETLQVGQKYRGQ